jgi:hypothetical protein
VGESEKGDVKQSEGAAEKEVSDVKKEEVDS